MRTFVITAVTAVLAMAGGNVMAENFVKPGLSWKTHGIYGGPSGIEHAYNDYELKDAVAGNTPCLQIWRQDPSSSDPASPKEFIKVNGDKVFISDSGENWKLFYDFGVQPGDSIEVYSPFSEDNKMGILVTGIVQDPENPGFERIEFKQFHKFDSQPMEYYDLGYWIKGLGSALGLQFSTGFGLSPGPGYMFEASLDGNVIYRHKLGSVKNLIMNNNSGWHACGSEGTLQISNLTPGSHITVYSTDGIAVHNTTSHSESVSIPGLRNGIYLISVNGSCRKIRM